MGGCGGGPRSVGGSRPNGAGSFIVLNDDAVATFFAEFHENVVDVNFDGAGTKPQFAGDVFI